MPGTRTSPMATRITTTRTTTIAPVLSAEKYERRHAGFSFEELVQAYFDCRRAKRNTQSALLFESSLERNLHALFDELASGSYQPGRSISFVVTRPKPREVWAADFRDRIVHHLLYNKVAQRFHNSFIADSCACIPGRGTLYGAKRLESKIRGITQNWSRQAYYLKMDLANFFVSINKHTLRELLATKITEPWWMWLTDAILFHDPRSNYEFHGNPDSINLVPEHKRLTNQPAHMGLPIGNLSSQFFANVLLNELDQYCKHKLRAQHYIRYVDDLVLLHESSDWLNGARTYIEAWLPARLGVRVNPSKTILQPVDRGVDFVGQIILPWRRVSRPSTVNTAIQRVLEIHGEDLLETANSYFGILGQASHSHRNRARLANALRKRGHSINQGFTKTFRKAYA